jgi:hypothetical protein
MGPKTPLELVFSGEEKKVENVEKVEKVVEEKKVEENKVEDVSQLRCFGEKREEKRREF